MNKLLLICLAFLACGESTPPVITETRLKEGQWVIYNKIIWAEGNCGWLKPETHFNAKIDEEGKIDFENQLPIGMECTTRYGARVGGATTIEMDCRSNDINLTTDGFVSQTREFGFGTGVIWGNVSGCRKLYVDWQVHFAR